MREGPVIYYAATTAAVLFWSASFIATKIAYSTFEPIQLGAVRTAIAAALFLLLRIVKREHDRPHPKDMFLIASSGLLGITLYFAMENIGVSLTSAANAALIVASFPAVTGLLEFAIFRIKPGRIKVFGIALAVFGVYILTVAKPDSQGEQTLLGNLCLIGAGVVWAIYNLLVRKVAGRYSGTTVSFYQMLFGSVFFLPLLWLERGQWKVPDGKAVAALLYLSVFCSVAAFLLYNFGLRKLSASTSVTLMNLVPIFGLLLSVGLLAERVTARQLAGGAVVLAGVILSAKKEEQKDERRTEHISNRVR